MHIFDSISNNSSTMPVFTAFIKLCLVISGISSLDIYRSPRAFCYDRPHCDFSTSEWPELCQVGKKQSPIDLVTQKESELVLKLPVSHFRADHFFLQNNGHTLNLDLTSKDKVMFPIENEGDMQYKLYNVHFHWGKDDTIGSEHAVGSKKFSMEAHFVHYDARYKNLAEAVSTGGANALAVLGVFFQAKKGLDPHPLLQPITKNLEAISKVHTFWAKVDGSIDLTSLMPKSGDFVFRYKGSLTTPGCNEQVNWFVAQEPVLISPSDTQAFRSLLDKEEFELSGNFRPIQQLHDRNVTLHRIVRE